MARADRNGNRMTRNERLATRVPEMGYYIIITDTIGTERVYFEGLKETLPEELKGKLVIKVIECNTAVLVSKCMEIVNENAQYRIPCIVFDRDRVVNFDKIIARAESIGAKVGWSNPCFEIWMYAYFGKIPCIPESKDCCTQFSNEYKKQTGIDYSKTDKDLYKRLVSFGNEGNAIEKMERRHNQHKRDGKEKYSDMCPCSTVYEIVSEIRKKVGDRS